MVLVLRIKCWSYTFLAVLLKERFCSGLLKFLFEFRDLLFELLVFFRNFVNQRNVLRIGLGTHLLPELVVFVEDLPVLHDHSIVITGLLIELLHQGYLDLSQSKDLFNYLWMQRSEAILFVLLTKLLAFWGYFDSRAYFSSVRKWWWVGLLTVVVLLTFITNLQHCCSFDSLWLLLFRDVLSLGRLSKHLLFSGLWLVYSVCWSFLSCLNPSMLSIIFLDGVHGGNILYMPNFICWWA